MCLDASQEDCRFFRWVDPLPLEAEDHGLPMQEEEMVMVDDLDQVIRYIRDFSSIQVAELNLLKEELEAMKLEIRKLEMKVSKLKMKVGLLNSVICFIFPFQYLMRFQQIKPGLVGLYLFDDAFAA
ncbi:hypothetical protein ACLOJK_015570 [Asimina triloba]